ncbi:MAG TPA: tRNA(Ile)-lysidine synthetase [Persephonella sp.]|uniref:tRNA(Ile)-lysidine synthase n=1 Tax=Persephonella marina (strain DSM 14350 / EX-H1) TaxID=123214 RepID=TILS_PERMH|nr:MULTISPECIES: tRNA lysidine(34) synthetase TilS [Persephonella]C0QU23.1 RecName: Full=tRNA(Ile)-lysidine synthase; AltName: Full=tRNA(Ile)-2-lysyl-cytidine synthase; AltName: Full=tRNA(Ile)-lysidine synthetase [Persephonella marina EX-H1]ACO04445.1 tRNA(Ile)-lysidine synthase [Persephonella marina EX-H1]HCB70195.1 tRNA(Ile)-lysidine synthetase [Persephonella sp.]
MVEKKFLEAVKKYSLISEGDRILVAFSGGIDSTVLTYLLIKFRDHLKISDIYLAHLNHSLRKESDEDQRFCEDFAKKYGLEIFTKKVDIKSLAEKEKKSIEQKAREERYSFFRKVMEERSINRLATGHHLSDLVETMIMWFIQGNRKGIKGFRPKERDIIRPLYLINKDQIENYAREKGIEYRIDITNFETDFLRNRIRHNIIPHIKGINPSLEGSLLTLSYFLSLDDQYLEEESEKISQKFLNGKIELEELLVYDKALVYRAIQNWIYRKTGVYPSYRQIMDIMEIIEKKEGTKSIRLSPEYNLIRRYSTLYIEKVKEKTEPYQYRIKPGEKIFVKEANLYIKSYIETDYTLDKLKDERKKVCFQIESMEDAEFVVRNRRKGDRFIPFGRKKEKKLKDVMIDLKIPSDMRENIPLVVYGNKILWIAGYKRSAYFPVTEKGKKLICFELEEV